MAEGDSYGTVQPAGVIGHAKRRDGYRRTPPPTVSLQCADGFRSMSSIFGADFRRLENLRRHWTALPGGRSEHSSQNPNRTCDTRHPLRDRMRVDIEHGVERFAGQS